MVLWNNSIEVSEEDYDWWIENGVVEERDVESQKQADAFCESMVTIGMPIVMTLNVLYVT